MRAETACDIDPAERSFSTAGSIAYPYHPTVTANTSRIIAVIAAWLICFGGPISVVFLRWPDFMAPVFVILGFVPYLLSIHVIEPRLSRPRRNSPWPGGCHRPEIMINCEKVEFWVRHRKYPDIADRRPLEQRAGLTSEEWIFLDELVARISLDKRNLTSAAFREATEQQLASSVLDPAAAELLRGVAHEDATTRAPQ